MAVGFGVYDWCIAADGVIIEVGIAIKPITL